MSADTPTNPNAPSAKRQRTVVATPLSLCDEGEESVGVTPSAISLIPDDVLENVLLEKLDARDLCVLQRVSHRFKALAECDRIWLSLFAARWGCPMPRMWRAKALAGSWRALYASKSSTERTSAPWTRPCQHELQASLQTLTARKTSEPDKQLAAIFLLDGSGSVHEEDFQTMVDFVTTCTDALRAAGGPDCKVGVLQFSNDVRVEFSPEAPLEAEPFAKTMKEMVRMNGGTNIAVAIQKAGALLKRHAQTDAIRHVILITDGRVDSYQAREARQMAERLADEQRNVSFFAFGVGRGVDRAELLHIIGGASPTAPQPGSSSHSSGGGGGLYGGVMATPPAVPAAPSSPAASSANSTGMGVATPALSSHLLAAASLPLPPSTPSSAATTPAAAGSGSGGVCSSSPPPSPTSPTSSLTSSSSTAMMVAAAAWGGHHALALAYPLQPADRYLDLYVREETLW